jgi:hypothetical protein
LSDIYKKVPDYEREWFFWEEGDTENGGYGEEFDIDYIEELNTPLGRTGNERMLSDLDFLADNFISFDGVDQYSLYLKVVQPLALLMMDGNVRYDYEEDELLTYMLSLFGPTKGYSLDDEAS